MIRRRASRLTNPTNRLSPVSPTSPTSTASPTSPVSATSPASATSTASRVDHERADLTDLALRAARGDRVALETFVARSLPDVWRYCAHVLGPAAADDATQATFLRALGSLPRFRGQSSARTWLIGVARHTCLDEMRSNGRRRRLQERLDAEPHHDSVQEPRPLEVERRVAELPADQREAFVLTQMLGFSYGEAADLSGCPVGTIRSRVARARARLLEAVELDDGSAVHQA